MAGVCAERAKRRPYSTCGVPAKSSARHSGVSGQLGDRHNTFDPDSKSTWKLKRLRVILLGDSGVGKTSLMRRYVTGSFNTNMDTTITVEEMEKKIRVDGERYALRLIDTAGQERFHSLRGNFYRGTDLVVFVFALDNMSSFCNLTTWRAEFMSYSDIPRDGDFPFVVVGNKADIPELKRSISDINAQAWCAANGNIPYVEASAKEGINVEEVFQAGIKRFLEFECLGTRRASTQKKHAGSISSSPVKSQGQGRGVKDVQGHRDTVTLTSDDIADMIVLHEKKKSCCSG